MAQRAISNLLQALNNYLVLMIMVWGSWSGWDHEDTANHYAGENDNRQHEGQDLVH